VSGLTLPPALPPAEEVAAVLDELREARRQAYEAAMIVARVGQSARDAQEQGATRNPVTAAYWRYENEVAELRATRWAIHVRKLENKARSLGAKP
jgi:hypothetical protein